MGVGPDKPARPVLGVRVRHRLLCLSSEGALEMECFKTSEAVGRALMGKMDEQTCRGSLGGGHDDDNGAGDDTALVVGGQPLAAGTALWGPDGWGAV